VAVSLRKKWAVLPASRRHCPAKRSQVLQQGISINQLALENSEPLESGYGKKISMEGLENIAVLYFLQLRVSNVCSVRTYSFCRFSNLCERRLTATEQKGSCYSLSYEETAVKHSYWGQVLVGPSTPPQTCTPVGPSCMATSTSSPYFLLSLFIHVEIYTRSSNI
jgi:hypothetical protein